MSLNENQKEQGVWSQASVKVKLVLSCIWFGFWQGPFCQEGVQQYSVRQHMLKLGSSTFSSLGRHLGPCVHTS